jgi:hypothetical protein
MSVFTDGILKCALNSLIPGSLAVSSGPSQIKQWLFWNAAAIGKSLHTGHHTVPVIMITFFEPSYLMAL